jgi:hypothetical protein
VGLLLISSSSLDPSLEAVCANTSDLFFSFLFFFFLYSPITISNLINSIISIKIIS